MGKENQDRPVRLSATANAVLGLLSFGRELSGYDLKRWADHSLSLFFWSPATSQIYSELRRLEELGFVSCREVPQDELRNKRVYRITDEGRGSLAHWLATEPVDNPILKHPVMLRVWLGDLMDPERLREVIDDHRGRTEVRLEGLARSLENSSTRVNGVYPELIIRWAERYYQAEHDNATQLLRELEQLEASTGNGEL